MPRLKARRTEENGLKTRLVEERWHVLALALLAERAITAGRSRAARQANGHLPESPDGLSLAVATNGELQHRTNGDAELGTANSEAELGTARAAKVLMNGGPKSWTKRLRTKGARTNGVYTESVAHNGTSETGVAGVSQSGNGGAGISQRRVGAWEFGSGEEAWGRLREWLREYFVSDHRRGLQTALGLLWLLDGALQFQSFMYSHGFIATLNDTASGQPGWVASSMTWGAHLASRNLAFFNSLFALTQVAIGVGLLYRPMVKRALLASFGWALVVWWFGEGFGMLFMGTASPLTGAPGAVLLYGIIGLLAWPSERPGGLLSARGAKTAWLVLWLVMAWAWLLGPNSSPNATSDAISSAPSGLGVLSNLLNGFADAARGNGLIIAFVLSLASAAIGVCVALDVHPRRFLKLAIGLSLAYWVIGQGLGGIFTGTATDPNTGLVFVLLALAVWPLTADSAVTAPYRRLGLPETATGAFSGFGRARLEAAQRPWVGSVGLGVLAVAIAAVIVILATSGGRSSSPAAAGSAPATATAGSAPATAAAVKSGPLAALGHLQAPPPPGPIGPENVPVPSGPPLAAVSQAASGKAVDGVPGCVRQTQIVGRSQTHLTIFVQGFARQIPAGIGIPNGKAQYTRRGTFIPAGNCFSALRTDAADGVIQVREPTEKTYTLANFFAIWGQALDQDHVGPARGQVTAFVNGQPYKGNPQNIPLGKDTATIQLEVGRPLVAPVSGTGATDL